MHGMNKGTSARGQHASCVHAGSAARALRVPDRMGHRTRRSRAPTRRARQARANQAAQCTVTQGTTVTWGPGRPPRRYGQEEQGPPGQATRWRGTRASCGLGPLRVGDPHVTENVLENAGELAVAVGDVVSVLRQGPQDVREGRQAPVYERSLPEGRSCHCRHT